MSERSRVIIIGSGPSGYTAGLYLSRARLEPLLFSGIEIGGQLMYTSEVENYPGFPKGVRGPDLMTDMRAQAEKFGTKIIDAKISKIEILEKGFRVWKDDVSYETDSIIIATGAQSRMLGLEGEMNWLGQGLSTCAVCDAAFFRDRDVVVAGGGDSAMEDTLALAKFAKNITLVHRRGEFRASKIMQERVVKNEKVHVRLNTEITGLLTEGISLKGVKIKSEGKEEELVVDGVFYAIGHIPATAFLPPEILKNKEGYIVTHLGFEPQSIELAQKSLQSSPVIPYLTMTSVPGIFAAGDCVDFRYRQAVTAAAYGTMAALDVERWLDEQSE